MNTILLTAALLVTVSQEMPAEYAGFLKAIEKTGDYADGVVKANIPRNDLRVTISGRAVPTLLGFGGWLALTPATGGSHVMMGDLVLTEAEVNPVMSALLDNGLEVTALHNHFFWEQPRIFYMHVHGTGPAADIAHELQDELAHSLTALKLRLRLADPPAIASTLPGGPPPVDPESVEESP